MTSLDPNTTQPSPGAGPSSQSRPGSPVVAVVAMATIHRLLQIQHQVTLQLKTKLALF